jgi:hypothetical protein
VCTTQFGFYSTFLLPSYDILWYVVKKGGTCAGESHGRQGHTGHQRGSETGSQSYTNTDYGTVYFCVRIGAIASGTRLRAISHIDLRISFFCFLK